MSSKDAQNPRVMAAIEEKIRELAELVSQAEYGEEGPPIETDFASIEELGHQFGQRFARTIDQTACEQHGQHFGISQPCPQCGRLCHISNKQRELETRDGGLSLSEPACHCPTCDRTFFPSANTTET